MYKKYFILIILIIIFYFIYHIKINKIKEDRDNFIVKYQNSKISNVKLVNKIKTNNHNLDSLKNIIMNFSSITDTIKVVKYKNTTDTIYTKNDSIIVLKDYIKTNRFMMGLKYNINIHTLKSKLKYNYSLFPDTIQTTIFIQDDLIKSKVLLNNKEYISKGEIIKDIGLQIIKRKNENFNILDHIGFSIGIGYCGEIKPYIGFGININL